MNRTKMKKLRQMIELASTSLKDKDAQNVPELFPAWKATAHYEVGDRVRYNEILYKVLQVHDAQENWTPTDSPSLFARVLVIDDEILDWVQPDSTNPYMQGDKVKHNGDIWISDIDNNIWEPGVYGWIKEE